MGRVLVFLAPGFEEIEALTVVDILRRAGIDTDTVSISKDYTVPGAHGINVEADKVIAEVDFSDSEMIVLPGGMPGTKNLEACEDLMTQVDDYLSSGRYVAAICAAPTILGHRSLLIDKPACCYPGMEDQLQGAHVSFDKVVVSDKIITSRGMGTAIPFALKLVEIFTDRVTSLSLAEKIVYNEKI